MKISVVKGDIVKLKVGVIVNAASSDLLGPAFARKLWRAKGGVDGAIHEAAGLGLLEECKTLGGCETGGAKITNGYELAAKYVIHTVGPIYGREGGRESQLLANCYVNCLKLAKGNNIRSIAFPAISTGAYGYPKDEAALIAVETVKIFCDKNQNCFDEISFVCFDDENLKIYEKLM
ncbi:MAG: macro domain-containing protein [Candidatus Paceibacterota bacterium]